MESRGTDISKQGRQDENYYRALLDAIPDMIFCYSRDGIALDFKPGKESQPIVSPAEFLNKSLHDVLPKEVAKPLQENIEQVCATGESRTLEYDLVLHGQSRHYEGRIVPCGRDQVLLIARDIGKRKRAEIKLRENEAKYHTVVEASTDAIFLETLDGQVLDVNEKACEMYGYGKEELCRLRVADLIPEEVVPILPDLIDTELSTGGVFVESKGRRSDGSIFPAEINTKLVTIDGRQLVITYVRDITDRKKAEEALRDSERRLRQIIDLVPHMIYVKDRKGNFLLGNRAVAEALRTTVHELVGKPYAELGGAEREFKEYVKADRQVIDTGQPLFIPEETFTRPDGDVRVLQTIKIPYALPDSDELACLGVSIDITDRKRAEQELAESQRTLSTLMSNLPGMVYRCRVDPQWTMLFVSDGATELTGYSPTDFVHNRKLAYADIIHPQDRGSIWHTINEALFGRNPFLLTYRIITAEGKEKWVWEQGRGVFSPEGELISLEGFITDITDRKRAEEERKQLEIQLRQVQKMEALGQLAGGIAHDFNNLLTAISGCTEVALAMLKNHPRPEDLPAVQSAMEQVQQAGQRAASLTRQLLTFSRKQVTKLEVIDANRVVVDMEKLLRRLIGDHILLESALASGLRPLQADTSQIEQVIMNLVINARDAMPRGGRLKIETANVDLDEEYASRVVGARAGRHVMIAVVDTGTGMDQETLSHVFEPFYTTKPAGRGTGFGLATVYGIVTQMGGHAVVESEVGKGTTFRVYFPAVDDVTAQSAAEKTAGGLRGETILLCEDDELVRRLAVRILESSGYTVLEAEDGPATLKLAASHEATIDLLVTDVVMPEMNGRELANLLADQRPEMKVLFTSGYTSDLIASQGVLDEGLEFLQKPYKPNELLQRVRQILDGVKS